MNQPQSLSQKLDQYVQELDRVTQRWLAWLLELESEALQADRRDVSNMTAITASGTQMLLELNQLVVRREEILSESQTLGYSLPTLQSLARCLPVWSSNSFRTGFEAARARLAHLQRSHIAAWILFKQSADYCQDSLFLMMSGKTRNDFTIGENPPDPGGQLLDASL